MKKRKLLLASSLLSMLAVSTISTTAVMAEPQPTDTTYASVNVIDGAATFDSATDSIKFPDIPFTYATKEAGTSIVSTDGLEIKLTDNRSADASWDLTALIEYADLTGSTITLNNGSAISGLTVTPELPVIPASIEISATENKVASATHNTTSDQGVGPWDLSFGAEDIELSIPANVLATGSHSTTIKWILNDIPGE